MPRKKGLAYKRVLLKLSGEALLGEKLFGIDRDFADYLAGEIKDVHDLELEIGIVVGREGSNLTVEEARDHIAGYTILVDSSCRDGYGRETLGPTKRKDFNTALGPCLVTTDAIDIGDAACSIAVDGEIWFEGSTGAPRPSGRLRLPSKRACSAR